MQLKSEPADCRDNLISSTTCNMECFLGLCLLISLNKRRRRFIAKADTFVFFYTQNVSN